MRNLGSSCVVWHGRYTLGGKIILTCKHSSLLWYMFESLKGSKEDLFHLVTVWDLLVRVNRFMLGKGRQVLELQAFL